MNPHRRQLLLSPTSAACILALVVAGCATPVVNIADPDAFARNLFRIAEKGTAAEWGTQLTAARRAEPGDYVQKHFESWRRLLLELKAGAFASDMSIARFRIVDNTLEFESENEWHHLLHVAMEDGGWKINQD